MTETAPVSTETGETPAGGVSGNPEAEEAPRGNREARYRVERNEAREALSTAQVRIEQLQTREVERLAAEHLAQPGDLFTLGGKTLADLLDDNGDVDPELITETANEILGGRPGLRPRQRAVDPTQGLGNHQPPKTQPSWGKLLKV